MKYLINYADNMYRKAQRFNTWTAKHIAGFDKVIEYSGQDIDKDFYKANKDILDQPRGNGLWLWKPYLIYKTLSKVKDGDIVFYSDSGAYFTRKPKELWNIMKKTDLWVSATPLQEEQFTKKAVLNQYDPKKIYRKEAQFQASFLAIKKTSENMRIIKAWLDACTKIELLAPSDNEGESATFISHREDQSILSLLLKKNGIEPFQDPSQYSIYPEFYQYQLVGKKVILMPSGRKDYSPFLILHRRKRISLKVLMMPVYYYGFPKSVVLRRAKERIR